MIWLGGMLAALGGIKKLGWRLLMGHLVLNWAAMLKRRREWQTRRRGMEMN